MPSAEGTLPPATLTATTGNWPSAASSVGCPASAARLSSIQSRCFLVFLPAQALLIYLDMHGLLCSIYFDVLCLIQQAEEETDPEKAAKFSKRAKKFGIISIVLWFSLLASIPILMALFSYLITLQD